MKEITIHLPEIMISCFSKYLEDEALHKIGRALEDYIKYNKQQELKELCEDALKELMIKANK